MKPKTAMRQVGKLATNGDGRTNANSDVPASRIADCACIDMLSAARTPSPITTSI